MRKIRKAYVSAKLLIAVLLSLVIFAMSLGEQRRLQVLGTMKMNIDDVSEQLRERAPTKKNKVAEISSIDAEAAAVAEMGRKVNYKQVMMDKNEIDVVLRYLNGKHTYLEWGSGGSTVNFPQFVTGRVVSMEHFQPWCKKTREMLQKASKEVEHRCVPVNHSNSEGRYWKFKPYVDEIGNLEEETWDFVLIDGRARVACALKVLSYLDKQSVVVVHDFERINLPGDDDYSLILQYYDVLARTGESFQKGTGKRGIGVLRRKQKYDWMQGKHEDVQNIIDQLSQTRTI